MKYIVCSDLEPKPLDGSQRNLAWTSPWTLWVTSKYFFGLTPTPRGSIILEKLKNLNSPYMAQDEAGSFCGIFCGTFCAFFGGFFFGGGFRYFFEWSERSEASQRVSQSTGAKQPATS